MSTLDVVVGGMYGSEAKGHVTQRLVERHIGRGAATLNIRVGGPNAGHTGYDKNGKAWAFRQVPVGVVVDGPVDLMIAAGSDIDPPVLLKEIDEATEAGLFENKRLFVHAEATLIEGRHKAAEGALVGKIGSTGKGIGAARADRLMRGANRLRDDGSAMISLEERGAIIVVGDGMDFNDMYNAVVIEGTQGYALGLHAGFYPQCTTSDCRAIDFLSMAGVNPWNWGPHDVNIWVVAREFPIRVAGNSGPMKGETTWEELGLPEERTTVTQKVRRVGAPDWDLVAAAVRANGPESVRVALSMVDQLFPEVKDIPWGDGAEWDDAEKHLQEVENLVGAPVSLVMSGPNTAAWRNF